MEVCAYTVSVYAFGFFSLSFFHKEDYMYGYMTLLKISLGDLSITISKDLCHIFNGCKE